MKKKETKVVVVGCGAVANEAHLLAWRKIKGAVLTAVCDNNRNSAKSTALRWKIPHYYHDYETMLNSEKPTLVDICTPPDSHVSLISEAVKSGCNVIVEKPLVMTFPEIKTIANIFSDHTNRELKLGVGYNWLFHQQFLSLLRQIKKGEIGEILNVEIKVLNPPNDPMISNSKHWCHTMPGGRLGETLIHPVYLLYRLLGDLHPGDLHLAKRGNFAWVQYDELLISMKSTQGMGSIYVSFNSPGHEFPIINVYGTRGQLSLNGHNLNLILFHPSNNDSLVGRGMDSISHINKIAGSLTSNIFRKISGNYRSSHEILFQAFINCLNDEGVLPITFEEIFETSRIYLEIIDQIQHRHH
jgi:predicted dehydrogenase